MIADKLVEVAILLDKSLLIGDTVPTSIEFVPQWDAIEQARDLLNEILEERE